MGRYRGVPNKPKSERLEKHAAKMREKNAANIHKREAAKARAERSRSAPPPMTAIAETPKSAPIVERKIEVVRVPMREAWLEDRHRAMDEAFRERRA